MGHRMVRSEMRQKLFHFHTSNLCQMYANSKYYNINICLYTNNLQQLKLKPIYYIILVLEVR